MKEGERFYDRETLDSKKWLIQLGWWVLNAFGVYVLTKLFGHVETLVWGLVVQTPLPQETMLYGFVGIGVILATIFLFVHNTRTLLRSWFSKGFNAEIIGKKTIRLGERILFKARFDGALSNGYFTAKITSKAGKTLPTTGLSYEWLPYNDTYDLRLKRGLLRGSGPFETDWDWRVPLEYPTGDYEATIMVYDCQEGQEERVKGTEPIPLRIVRTHV